MATDVKEYNAETFKGRFRMSCDIFEKIWHIIKHNEAFVSASNISSL